MRGINSQGIILKTKISQLLKKGNLTEIFAVNSKSNNKHGRDMDVNQNPCSNKNGLILTSKNKTGLDNSKIGDGTSENSGKSPENLNAPKTQEYSNRTITVFRQKCIETENQFKKTPFITKSYTTHPGFKREVVTTNPNLVNSSIIRSKKNK